jgi:hypothetical protein
MSLKNKKKENEKIKAFKPPTVYKINGYLSPFCQQQPKATCLLPKQLWSLE